MGAPKGKPKAGGRQKGTPNKVTQDLRTWISKLLDSNRDRAADCIKKLEPHQFMACYEKLCAYVIPKQQAVQAQIDINTLSESQIDYLILEISKKIENEN